MRASRAVGLVLLAAATTLGPEATGQIQSPAFSLFERYLESLRHQAGIPGLSAAIVHQGRIVWEGGFGYQDLESAIAARPDTPYPVGDVTQTLAAALVLQCAERGQGVLDALIQQWAPELPEPATIKEVLAHASSSTASGFKYDPLRYVALTAVIDECGRAPYRRVLGRDILDRLAMIDSVPGNDLRAPSPALEALFDARDRQRYAAVLARMAVGYKLDRKGKAARTEHPLDGVSAAAGLVSTVRDLARFVGALDEGVLLHESTLAMSWSNQVNGQGLPLPSGLGWFVQTYNGERVVWHFGLTGSYSALLVKVPSRDATLILLANSDALASSFPASEGDLTRSVFATLFLRLFL